MTGVWLSPWIIAAAFALEGLIGWPDRWHRRFPHPIVWIGGLIAGLEESLNRPAWTQGLRRGTGVLTVIVLVMTAGGVGWAIQSAAALSDWSWPLVVVCGVFGLAGRSLYDHVAAVARALAEGDMSAAREAVGRIVGRDVQALDPAGVAAAGLESLAESFNDGVAAPLFWFVVAGLPGLFIYKAVNTADSMIGHREERWRAFGWAAARLDDLMNLIPARLAGVLIVLVAGPGRMGRAWRTMLRDAKHHASPNAGWPEAAMAGALGVRLGGPVFYDGVLTQRPVFGDGAPPRASDLSRGLALYVRACAVLLVFLIAGGIAWRL